jgi:ABC-2 type transport system ATP-binding protein
MQRFNAKPDPGSTVLETRALGRTFGDIRAVDELSLEVRAGEMFALVGPDGAGKTTTIRMLCGILAPSAGTGTILGFDIVKEPDALKRHIGYLSQRFSLYGDLTIDENIEFFAEINEVYDYAARREELLEFTRLTPFRSRLAERLSGGMKQKLALACTLIHTPRLILLDEPTTGVDPVSRRDFWSILQSLLKDGITIVMSTPYLDEAERCTRVALMNKGRLLEVDTPDGLRSHMRSDILELVTDRVREAANVLRGLREVLEVQAFGDRLHVVVPDAAAGGQAIEATLRKHNITVAGRRTVPPSLENVFISLLAHTEQEEPAS